MLLYDKSRETLYVVRNLYGPNYPPDDSVIDLEMKEIEKRLLDLNKKYNLEFLDEDDNGLDFLDYDEEDVFYVHKINGELLFKFRIID